MLNYLRLILIEIRPRQWIKNLTIFTFLIFSKQLFNPQQFLTTLYAFISFTFVTSAIYIFNDILDYDADKNNPDKKNRPIASDAITKPNAFVLGIFFLIANLITSFALGEYFFVMCISYFVLMILYSLWLKNLAIIDALIIAGGFVIRVVAGGFVIGTANIYSWVIIVTISLSLLLAFGKRRSEITLLGDASLSQRKVLAKYPVELLNSLISALVASTFLSYILLTFQTDLAPARSILLKPIFVKLPDTVLRSSHLLKLTIPIVFYGLARYLYIIYTKKYSGTPEKALYTDLPMAVTVIVWFLSFTLLLYV